MIQVKAEILVSDKRWKKLTEDMQKLATKEVLVGIPSNAPAPTRTTTIGERGGKRKRASSINMATLGYIMENGSPLNKIPPRPFMKQTWENNKDKVRTTMNGIFSRILKGDDVTRSMQRLALNYAGKMKETFTTGQFKGNAPITIDGGWMRNKKSGKPVHIEGKHSSKPLIDHGNLRKSIKGWVKG